MSQGKLSKEKVLDIVRSTRWYLQRANGAPFYIMMAAYPSGWLVEKVLGKGYSHFVFAFSDDGIAMYYDEDDLGNICEAYYQRIFSREGLEKLVATHKAQYDESGEKSAYDVTVLDSLSDSELVALSMRLRERLGLSVGIGHAIEAITFGSEKKLRSLFAKKGNFTEQEFGLVCSPVYPSFLSFAQMKLWQIKHLEGQERAVAIEDFIKEYGWIENTYLGSKKFTAEDVIRRAEGLTHEPVIEDENVVRSRKEAILQRFDLSETEGFMVTTIELCFHWQDERKRYILQSIETLEPVMRVLAKRFGVSVSDLKMMGLQELSEENLGNPAFHEELKKRGRGSVYYATAEDNYVFTGSDYELFSNALHIDVSHYGDELKGVAASPGVVRGRVRVCESVSAIDQVQIGEVLVASMTRPEYLPAMQKAVAFVTDEGGITSHAAIVAREMKKPCVIGTKVATRVLKDGDLVEVNADKGLVRKL
jgi:phosphohistidine swiveling domain-containing protein